MVDYECPRWSSFEENSHLCWLRCLCRRSAPGRTLSLDPFLVGRLRDTSAEGEEGHRAGGEQGEPTLEARRGGRSVESTLSSSVDVVEGVTREISRS